MIPTDSSAVPAGAPMSRAWSSRLLLGKEEDSAAGMVEL